MVVVRHHNFLIFLDNPDNPRITMYYRHGMFPILVTVTSRMTLHFVSSKHKPSKDATIAFWILGVSHQNIHVMYWDENAALPPQR